MRSQLKRLTAETAASLAISTEPESSPVTVAHSQPSSLTRNWPWRRGGGMLKHQHDSEVVSRWPASNIQAFAKGLVARSGVAQVKSVLRMVNRARAGGLWLRHLVRRVLAVGSCRVACHVAKDSLYDAAGRECRRWLRLRQQADTVARPRV